MYPDREVALGIRLYQLGVVGGFFSSCLADELRHWVSAVRRRPAKRHRFLSVAAAPVSPSIAVLNCPKAAKRFHPDGRRRPAASRAVVLFQLAEMNAVSKSFGEQLALLLLCVALRPFIWHAVHPGSASEEPAASLLFLRQTPGRGAKSGTDPSPPQLETGGLTRFIKAMFVYPVKGSRLLFSEEP